MTRSMRYLPPLALASMVLLSGCGQAPDPNAKKVIEACLSVSAADASAILGQTLTANKMTGDDAPRSICAYNDSTNTTYGLVQLQSAAKIKDQQADLASDQKFEINVYKTNVKPATAHPAQGFVPGSFYLYVSPAMGSYSVQLYTFVEGYMLLVVVNNLKDYASGEKLAAAMANKVAANIKNGGAFQTQ